jgi:hypothetical protein
MNLTQVRGFLWDWSQGAEYKGPLEEAYRRGTKELLEASAATLRRHCVRPPTRPRCSHEGDCRGFHPGDTVKSCLLRKIALSRRGCSNEG